MKLLFNSWVFVALLLLLPLVTVAIVRVLFDPPSGMVPR